MKVTTSLLFGFAAVTAAFPSQFYDRDLDLSGHLQLRSDISPSAAFGAYLSKRDAYLDEREAYLEMVNSHLREREAYFEARTPTKAHIAKRALSHPPTKSYTCGSVSFAPAAITAAITQGMKLHESKTFLMSLPECHKDVKFCMPKGFGNHEALSFPNCAGKSLSEFPILSNGGVFPGGAKAGWGEPARVIFAVSGGSATFCGLTYHDGAKKGGVAPCK